jgi:hypothetical protein
MQLSLLLPIEIPLSKGYVTIIDPIDIDLSLVRWQLLDSRNGGQGKNIYASRVIRSLGKRHTQYLHREILQRMLGRDLGSHEQVDHIDGDGLNNTRSNLRLASSAQNMRNRRKRPNTRSALKGISWNKRRQKWHASIFVDGRSINLGLYQAPEEAHAAYCEAAKKYHREFARMD